MKTQRGTMLDAINAALAGYEAKSYKGDYTIKLKNDMLAVYHRTFKRGKMIDAYMIDAIKDLTWHISDDRSLKGYYDGI